MEKGKTDNKMENKIIQKEKVMDTDKSLNPNSYKIKTISLIQIYIMYKQLIYCNGYITASKLKFFQADIWVICSSLNNFLFI